MILAISFFILLSIGVKAQCNFTINTDSTSQKSCKYALEEVVWQDEVNVIAISNNLIRTSGSGWDADAISVNQIHNFGFAQTIVAETNTNRMFGINSSNDNNSYTDLDFAFYLRSNNEIRIYESGSNRGAFGTYYSGDTLRISVVDNIVHYVINDRIIYTSQTTPTIPSFVDVSINDLGGTLQDVIVGNSSDSVFYAIEENPGASPTYQWLLNSGAVGTNDTFYIDNLNSGDLLECILTLGAGGCTGGSVVSNEINIQTLSPFRDVNYFVRNDSVPVNTCIYVKENIVWQSISGLVESGLNSVSKNSGSNDWDAGAFSFNEVREGGYVEMVVNETNTNRMFGLNSVNENVSYTDIDYALYLRNNGEIRVYENGSNQGSWGGYAAGDTFRVSVVDNEVRYIQNGNIIYTSSIAPTLPLFVDMSLNSVGSSMEEITVSNPSTGRFEAGMIGMNNINYQWYLNGNPVGTNSSIYTNSGIVDGDSITCQFYIANSSFCGSDTSVLSNLMIVEDKNPKSNLIFSVRNDSIVNASCRYAFEEVAWQSLSGLTLTSGTNNVQKQSGSNDWNTGGFSYNQVDEGGFMQTIINETNTNRMIGLNSINQNTSYTDIDYAIYLRSNGDVRIYENGSNMGSWGSYNSGDTFQIAVVDTTIRYLQNGNIFYTSTIQPSLPLYVDMSLNTVGSTAEQIYVNNTVYGVFSSFVRGASDIQYQWKLNGIDVGTNSPTYTNTSLTQDDSISCELALINTSGCSSDTIQISNTIVINEQSLIDNVLFSIRNDSIVNLSCQYAYEEVSWQSISGLEYTSGTNNLQKQNGTNNWSTGAFSYNQVDDGGYMQTIVNETNTNRMIGLNSVNENTSYTDIDYAFYLINNSEIRIYENGSNMGSWGSYSSGDTLRIAVVDSTVRYLQNGNIIYTSANTPTLPLFVDISLNTVGSTAENLYVNNTAYGAFSALVNGINDVQYQWRLNGADVGTDNPNYINTSVSQDDTISCLLTLINTTGCAPDTFELSNSIAINTQSIIDNVLFSIRNDSIIQNTCLFATEEVSWQSISALSINGVNSVTKTSGTNSWSAGAFSYNEVTEGGFMQTIINETNTNRMLGLNSVNENVSYTDIDYAVYLRNNGTIRIYENGSSVANVGSYSSGDTIRVAVLNGEVKYILNGSTIYTSATAPTLPLYVDLSLNTVGSTVEEITVYNGLYGNFSAFVSGIDNNNFQWMLNGGNVGTNIPSYSNTGLSDGDLITSDFYISGAVGCGADTIVSSNEIDIEELSVEDFLTFYITRENTDRNGCQYAVENVRWQTLSGLENSENNITRSSGSNSWDASAFSFNSVSDNGYLQFELTETNTNRMIGLNSNDENSSYTDIDYAFYLNGSTIRIYENGSNMGTYGTGNTGDIFRIDIIGGVVTYLQNGTILYTSAAIPTLPLYVDLSMNTVGSTVNDIKVANPTYGYFEATAENGGNSPVYQWFVNGVVVGPNSAIFNYDSINGGDAINCIITADYQGCSVQDFTSNNISIVNNPPQNFVPNFTAVNSTYLGISSDWYDPTNWDNGVPHSGSIAVLPNGLGNYPTIPNGASVYGLDIQTGANLDLQNEAFLTVFGDLNNDGTFNSSNGSLVFKGCIDTSRIFLSNDLNVFDFTVNNSLGLNVNGADLIISDTLNFIDGLINCQSCDLVFNDNAGWNFASDSSYVVDSVRKIGNDAFIFPVGDNNLLRTIAISAPSNVSDEFSANYYEVNPDIASPTPFPNDSVQAPIDHISGCEYWILERLSGSSNVNVTLSWAGNSCGVGDMSTLRVSKFNGTFWEDHGNGGTTGNNSSGTIVSSSPITSFSPFTLASTSLANPLPAENIEFMAHSYFDHVKINWLITSNSELSSVIIEKSQDLKDWKKLNTDFNQSANLKQGEGLDLSPYSGISYYRLVAITSEGQKSVSQIEVLNFFNSEYNVYPIPFNEVLYVQNLESHETLKIFDILGNQIYSGNSSTINTKDWNKGIYLLRIVNSNSHTTFSYKILKE